MKVATKVKLRSLMDEDIVDLARLANNRNVWNNLRDRMPHPYSEVDAKEFITITKNEQPRQNFSIEYEGKFCGVIGFLLQYDVYRGSAEIGYWLGEPFWRKGIATGAVRLITEYGFSELNLRRIYASVFAFNKASARVLEKNGYLP